jgi:hypothetical protein
MSRDAPGDYQVGYGKPPRHTQFKRGQSGNPRGRPSGSKNFATLLSEVLNEPVVVTEKGGRKTMTKQHAIVTQLVNQSLKGNLPATKLLIERQQEVEGRSEPETAESLFGSADKKVIEQLRTRLSSKKRASND